MFSEDDSNSRILKMAAVGVGVVLFLVLAIVLFSRKDLPVTRGKDIHEWLTKLRLAAPRDQFDAIQAIREMGPVAIPYLKEEAAGEHNPEHRTVLEDLIAELDRQSLLGPGGKPKLPVVDGGKQ